jgi:uncharacterized protein (TIGR00296 family)
MHHAFLALSGSVGIIAQGRPCRFCAIAVTLATRTCMRLRTRSVGGLSSAALPGHRRPHSPSRIIMRRSYDILLMDQLSPIEGELAVRLARTALESRIRGDCMNPGSLPPVFSEKRGVFVCVKRHGELRGCIGFPYPMLPLGDAIMQAAVAAGTEDPRFAPVGLREIEDLSVEVTVLTPPVGLQGEPEERPDKIEVGKHGIIVRGFGTSGLLLPQVATEYGWNSRTFLDHTCMKAGLRAGCWTGRNVEVLTFEGQIFSG